MDWWTTPITLFLLWKVEDNGQLSSDNVVSEMLKSAGTRGHVVHYIWVLLVTKKIEFD